MDDIPRRNKIDCWTPAELAIGLAMETVEKMAADERLTDAILLLASAKHSVADYLEGVNTRRHVVSDLDEAFQLGRQASWDDARASVTQLQSEVTSLKAKLESALSQVCGACGHPWTGEKCGQADNDHPFQTCYPVAAVNPLAAECETLRAMVYVPGLWRCPKCEFQSLQSNLNASDGSVTASDKPGEKCPNCDSPLWRVSERDAGNRLSDRLEKEIAANASLRADLVRANEQNDLTHTSYVAENNRVMAEREALRADLAQQTELVGLLQTEAGNVRRLEVALWQVRRDLEPIHCCDVVHRDCQICRAVVHIDDAIARRPHVDKPEKSAGPNSAAAADMSDDMPWDRVELRGWSIVGMNHYHVGGARQLFVAMTNADGRCITAEGSHERQVWKDLARKAYRAPG